MDPERSQWEAKCLLLFNGQEQEEARGGVGGILKSLSHPDLVYVPKILRVNEDEHCFVSEDIGRDDDLYEWLFNRCSSDVEAGIIGSKVYFILLFYHFLSTLLYY